MSQSQRLQAGHLMTTQERRILRDAAEDLERQRDRASDPDRVRQLETLLGNVKREQLFDRETRPRKRGKPKR